MISYVREERVFGNGGQTFEDSRATGTSTPRLHPPGGGHDF